MEKEKDNACNVDNIVDDEAVVNTENSENTETTENKTDTDNNSENGGNNESKKDKRAKKQNSENSKANQEIERLKSQLDDSNKKADEYKQSWVRCAADFENFKKRNADSRANAYQDGKSDAIKSILAIGDNLEHALATVNDEAVKEGLLLVIRQFGETLKNMGVEEMNPVGEKFDPNLYEAVCQIDGEEGDESETIKTVFRKGYRLNGKMLRYAQVVVVK